MARIECYAYEVIPVFIMSNIRISTRNNVAHIRTRRKTAKKPAVSTHYIRTRYDCASYPHTYIMGVQNEAAETSRISIGTTDTFQRIAYVVIARMPSAAVVTRCMTYVPSRSRAPSAHAAEVGVETVRERRRRNSAIYVTWFSAMHVHRRIAMKT